MFCNHKKDIEDLRQKVEALDNNFFSLYQTVITAIHDLRHDSKQKFMYELREEDIELIEDGRKYRKIRKIIH
jgi:hypothetical protein